MRKRTISAFKGTSVNPFISVSTYIVQIQDNTRYKILKIVDNFIEKQQSDQCMPIINDSTLPIFTQITCSNLDTIAITQQSILNIIQKLMTRIIFLAV